MKRALYQPEVSFFALLGFRNDPVEVEFLSWETIRGVKMAKILYPTDPKSILGLYAKHHGLPHPRPEERLVPAERVTLIDADA